MYNFTNRITNVYIINSPISTSNEHAYIDWSAEIELRTWGIKDITTTIKKLKVCWEEDGEEKSVEVEGEIKTSWNSKLPLYPSSVTWDTDKNEFMVEF